MNSKLIIIFPVFLFSIILWIFVTLSNEYSTQISVPVNVKTVSSLQKISSVNPSVLSLTVKGKGWQLIKFVLGFQENYNIRISTSEEIDRVIVKNYLKYNSWITNSAQVISFEPEIITIKTEKGFHKKVVIEPDLELSFRDGFGLVSGINVNPDSINIYGPWSKTILISSIQTEKLLLTDLEGNVNLSAKLIKPNFINFNVNEVEINFEVEKIVDRQLDEVVVEIVNLPSNKELLLSSEKISLVLKGGIQKLANLKANDISAKIDYNHAINDSTGFLIPEILLPQNIELLEMKPNKLKYIIKQN